MSRSNPVRRRTSGVAVVIPAFRAERWVGAAVDSALGQTLPPDEVVVVDDGSPEGLVAGLSSRLDRIVYARQDNRGPGAARNTGVALTAAPLVAFLDADDLWEPGKLAAQVRFLDRHEDCAMVCGDVWVFGGGEPPRRRSRTRPDGGAFEPSLAGLLRENRIATTTVVIRRDVFDEVGGFDEDPALVGVEDYDLWLRVAERSRIGYLDTPLARYRRTATGLSGPARFLGGVSRVLDKTVGRLGSRPELRPLIRGRRAALFRDFAWQLLAEQRAGAAVEPILEALALCPGNAAAWRLLARALLGRFRILRRQRDRRRDPDKAPSRA